MQYLTSSILAVLVSSLLFSSHTSLLFFSSLFSYLLLSCFIFSLSHHDNMAHMAGTGGIEPPTTWLYHPVGPSCFCLFFYFCFVCVQDQIKLGSHSWSCPWLRDHPGWVIHRLLNQYSLRYLCSSQRHSSSQGRPRRVVLWPHLCHSQVISL